MLAGALNERVAAGRSRCHAGAMNAGMLKVQKGSVAEDHQMRSAPVDTAQCRNASPLACGVPVCSTGVSNHCVASGVGVFHIDDDENGRAFTTFCGVLMTGRSPILIFTQEVNVTVAIAAHPSATASFTRRDRREARARP